MDDIELFSNTFLTSLPKRMGTHAEGCSNVEKTVSEYFDMPIQVFLTPQRGSFPNYSSDKIKSLIKKNKLILFSHLPYFINLCSPATKMYSDPIVSLNCVIRELRAAHEMSFNGCVIHVGKNTKKLDLDEAIVEMKYYILWCIIHATPECPLLLETCCGCGTELLSDLYDFCNFYHMVVEDFPGYYEEAFGVKPTMECPFGICIDFAHTFAAGYLPMESLSILEDEIGVNAIKLIHYNDSRESLGGRKDRHEIPGLGNIPIEELYEAYNYALKHDIAMVRE